MKKTILLLTALCIGQSYSMHEGMNEERELSNYWSQLPKELHQEIITTALATSKNLDQAINTIKTSSALQGINYDNLKNFTSLVHLLAKKFTISTHDIAKKFKTKTSAKYIELGSALMNAIKYSDIIKITELIDAGADVNFMTNYYFWVRKLIKAKYQFNTPLIIAMLYEPNVKIVELLLNAGADPDLEGYVFEPLLNTFIKIGKFSSEALEVQQLLKERKKK